MTNVIDWILDLFRDPVAAQAFVNDPDRAMANAGVSGVTTAQVNAVAATVAPAAVIHGGGNPVHGLQQAVAETHGIAFTPQYAPSFAPEAFSNNNSLSHNDTLSNNDTLSHNDVLSPNAGHDVQQGGVNLDFGDITLGDKNTASDGSVYVTAQLTRNDPTDQTNNKYDVLTLAYSGASAPVVVPEWPGVAGGAAVAVLAVTAAARRRRRRGGSA